MYRSRPKKLPDHPSSDAGIRRLSAGENLNPIPLLRDIDQPFIFDVKFADKPYRLEFYDTSSPENWRLLEPDVIAVCFDISQRLSLIHMQKYVCPPPSLPQMQ